MDGSGKMWKKYFILKNFSDWAAKLSQPAVNRLICLILLFKLYLKKLNSDIWQGRVYTERSWRAVWVVADVTSQARDRHANSG